MSSEFAGLPPQERIAAYRAHAAQAMNAAVSAASKESREHFMFIAIQWEGMARDLELRLKQSK